MTWLTEFSCACTLSHTAHGSQTLASFFFTFCRFVCFCHTCRACPCRICECWAATFLFYFFSFRPFLPPPSPLSRFLISFFDFNYRRNKYPGMVSICIRISFSSSFTKRINTPVRMCVCEWGFSVVIIIIIIYEKRKSEKKTCTRITHVRLTRSTTPATMSVFSISVGRSSAMAGDGAVCCKPQAFFIVPLPFARTNLFFSSSFFCVKWMCVVFVVLFIFMFKHHSSHRNRV